MGLDIGCNCGCTNFRAGSYGGYSEWRRALAHTAGIELAEMQGFTADAEPKQWTGEEPFYELLYHSDCESAELLKDFKAL